MVMASGVKVKGCAVQVGTAVPRVAGLWEGEALDRHSIQWDKRKEHVELMEQERERRRGGAPTGGGRGVGAGAERAGESQGGGATEEVDLTQISDDGLATKCPG